MDCLISINFSYAAAIAIPHSFQFLTNYSTKSILIFSTKKKRYIMIRITMTGGINGCGNGLTEIIPNLAEQPADQEQRIM